MTPRISIFLLPILAILAATAPLSAQTFRFSIGGGDDNTPISDEPYPGNLRTTPRTLKPGQPFSLGLSAAVPSRASTGEPVLLQSFDGSTLTSGGTSFSFTGINGVGSARLTLSFEASAPDKPGEYTIPAQTVTVGRAKIAVPETRFKVRELAEGESAFAPARLAMKVTPGEHYVGLEIPVSLVVIDGTDESVISIQSLALEGGDDFTVITHGVEDGVETVNGVSQPVKVVKLGLRPNSGGSRKTSVVASVVVERADGSPVMKRIRSDTTELTVLHAPEKNKPASYAGAVGRFTVSPSVIEPGEKKAGEPFRLSFTVSGDGALDRLVPPGLSAAQWACRPGSPQFVKQSDGSLARRFVYTLTPVYGGEQACPAGEFSWFDPVAREYKRVSVGGLRVSVKGPEAPAEVRAASTDDAPALAEDPAPSGMKIPYATLADSPSFAPVQGALAALFAAAAAFTARRRHLDAHPVLRIRGRARRLLKKNGARARRALAAKDLSGYAAHARAALREGVAPALRADPGALTGEETLAALPIDEAARRSLATLFEAENTGRFAGGAPPAGLGAESGTLFTTLRTLEKSLR